MTLPTVSAVLFDLDGTLIDTAPEFIQIGLQLRAEAGLAPIDSETIWHSVSNGAIGMVQAALEMSADDPAFEHWRQRFLTLYETGLGNLSTLFARCAGRRIRGCASSISKPCTKISLRWTRR